MLGLYNAHEAGEAGEIWLGELVRMARSGLGELNAHERNKVW